jgi:Spy/CpxP family protein refolding chaperone
MVRRSSTCLVVALLGGILLAGCGGGSSQSTAAPPPTGSTAATSSTPKTGSTPKSSPALTAERGQFAVNTCKRTIATQLSLTTSAKTKLEAICNQARKGDIASIRKAAQEVCVEVIKASGGASSPAAQQAIAACKSAK